MSSIRPWSSASSLLAAIVLSAGALTSVADAQVGTAISYQGQLKNSGQVVNTDTDMRFTLFDAATAGNVVGGPVTILTVPVSNGLFNANPDFGFNPYTQGMDLWLLIEVRNPAGSGSYVAMGSRQKLTPAPYSLATRGIRVDSDGYVYVSGKDNTIKQAVIRLDGGDGAVNQYAGVGFFDRGVQQWGLGKDLANNFYLTTATTDRGIKMSLPDGKVGIGTAPTNNRLTLGGETAQFPPAAMAVLPSTHAASRRAAIDVGNWATVQDITGTGNLDFSIYQKSLDAHRMYFSPTGNVGIGTTTPTAKLQVIGDSRFNGRLRFGEDGENGNSIFLWRYNGPPGVSNMYLDLGAGSGGAFIIQRGPAFDSFQFFADGNAYKPGGGSWGVLSDERTKSDIQPLTGTLDRLLKLKGHSYSYKPEYVEKGRALPGTQIGLVAQEVETVFPDWVTTAGPEGLKVVNERSTTALMVEAMRDLRNEKDTEINGLKARLEKLEALVAAQTAAK